MLITGFAICTLYSYLTANKDVMVVVAELIPYGVDILSLTGPICLFITRWAWVPNDTSTVLADFVRLYLCKPKVPTVVSVL